MSERDASLLDEPDLPTSLGWALIGGHALLFGIMFAVEAAQALEIFQAGRTTIVLWGLMGAGAVATAMRGGQHLGPGHRTALIAWAIIGGPLAWKLAGPLMGLLGLV